MIRWMRRGMPDSAGGMSGALGALDEFLNPGAARARDLLDAQHERVMPTPSPGDGLLGGEVVVIRLPSLPQRQESSQG